ncbi:MAG: VOC family protein, partial [Alphaproteobacteria bacterium]|nr:VOC family protein [Alphaproteobacteria bacterium]
VKDYLERREGLAMLVLDSRDAARDAAQFAEAGIGDYEPFFFERSGRRPGGGETHVAFTLAFASDPHLPEASFFVCQQHFPEAFWDPRLQTHANGAVDVSAVTLSADSPSRHTAFLATFTGASSGDKGVSYALTHGSKLRVVAGQYPRGFAAFRVRVPDLSVVTQRLAREGVSFEDSSGCVAVRHGTYGVTVEFGSGSGESLSPTPDHD